MSNVVEFIKTFYEKIWFWFVVSVCSIFALCFPAMFKWLGFEVTHRWIIGLVAVVSFSLFIQNVCDCFKEYLYQMRMIRRVHSIPHNGKKLLRKLVSHKKQTFHVDIGKGDDLRIASHFNLERNKDNYVTFPNYLWMEITKKYKKKDK